MPSPFPGMNPYLEQNDTWQEFHNNFVLRAQEILAGEVGPNYIVKVEVRILELPAVVGEKHLSLEIRDRRNRRIITVLELLSPANKAPHEDREDYLAKRRQVLAGGTHFVEIDLRRGGQRPTPPELPSCDYYALICRYDDRPHVGVWPINLRDPLLVLPIPLDAPDAPVNLNLKDVLDRAYDAADYGKYIYAETPEPPLSAENETWARAFVPV